MTFDVVWQYKATGVLNSTGLKVIIVAGVEHVPVEAESKEDALKDIQCFLNKMTKDLSKLAGRSPWLHVHDLKEEMYVVDVVKL